MHDLTQTNLTKLDSLSHKFIKRWAGIPPCGTNVIFHSSKTLDIPSITDLHTLCHTLNITNIRQKGDIVVNSAIDNAIERESSYTRKQSITVISDKNYTCTVQEVSKTLVPTINNIKKMEFNFGIIIFIS